MKKNIFILVALVFLAAAAVLTWWFHFRPHREYEVLRLAHGPQSVYFTPHLLSKKLGFYSIEKIKIKQISCRNDTEALNALDSGSADAALVNPCSLVLWRASSLSGESGIMTVASLNSDSTYYLAALKGTAGGSISDLKDKVVITGPHESPLTVFFESMLRQSDLDPYREVTLITNIPEDLRIGSLLAGAGDYILLDEAGMARSAEKGLVQVMAMKTGFPSTVAVTTPGCLTAKTHLLQGMVNSLYKARIWLTYHNPDEIAGMVGDLPGMAGKSPGAALGMIGEGDSWAGPPGVAVEGIARLTDILDAAREMPSPVEPASLVHNSLAESSASQVDYTPPDRENRPWYKRIPSLIRSIS